MNSNKLIYQSQDFQSQNLKVDYISFKFPSLDENQERKIADYLFKLQTQSRNLFWLIVLIHTKLFLSKKDPPHFIFLDGMLADFIFLPNKK